MEMIITGYSKGILLGTALFFIMLVFSSYVTFTNLLNFLINAVVFASAFLLILFLTLKSSLSGKKAVGIKKQT